MYKQDYSILHFLMNIFWEQEYLSSCFKIRMVRPIPKKVPGQFRPITLLPTIARLFSLLLSERLRYWCCKNNIPHKSQGGGQANRSIHEHLH